jgi:hypothetical protein
LIRGGEDEEDEEDEKEEALQELKGAEGALKEDQGSAFRFPPLFGMVCAPTVVIPWNANRSRTACLRIIQLSLQHASTNVQAGSIWGVSIWAVLILCLLVKKISNLRYSSQSW